MIDIFYAGLHLAPFLVAGVVFAYIIADEWF